MLKVQLTNNKTRDKNILSIYQFVSFILVNLNEEKIDIQLFHDNLSVHIVLEL